MKTVISTPNAPGAIGPYSQGYAFGDLVITSGQIPVDPATGAIPEGIAAQAEQSCKNVGAILEAAGVTLESVVKTTCFLADMGDFAAFNEVYAKYFTSKPARSCVAVKDLPKGVLRRDGGHLAAQAAVSQGVILVFLQYGSIHSVFPQQLFCLIRQP